LKAAPEIDRDATHAFVERLYPEQRLAKIQDGSLWANPNPPDRHIYAGCFPGLTVLCAADVALDRPSQLPRRFRDEAGGRTTYLHAMHSVVDWFAYAIWTPDGQLQRSLSLSPDDGIIENLGNPLAFEAPYWAGEKALEVDDDEERYALPFHPLELAEDALRTLFGFNYEGKYLEDDPHLDKLILAGYRVDQL
jgi:hypothetical protein